MKTFYIYFSDLTQEAQKRLLINVGAPELLKLVGARPVETPGDHSDMYLNAVFDMDILPVAKVDYAD